MTDSPGMRGMWDATGGPIKAPQGTRIALYGWACDADCNPVTRVRALVDGQVWTTCRPDRRRDDVAAVLGVDAQTDDAGYGWKLVLNTAGLEPGSYEVHVESMSSNGYFAVLGVQGLEVEPADGPPPIIQDDGPVVLLDHPFDDGIVEEEIVHILGWVHSGREHLDSVRIFVGGRELGPARCFIPRPDVAAALGDPERHFSGFEFYWTRDSESAEHQEALWAVARTCSGYGARSETRTIRLGALPEAQPTPVLGLGGDVQRTPVQGSAGKLRVLVATHSLGLGGGQLWLSELLDHLMVDKDLELSVVATADGPLRDDLERAGVHVHLTRNLEDSDPAMYECRIQELAALLGGHDFDVVLCNTIGTFFIGAAAHRLGIPVVFAVHEHFLLTEWWPYKDRQTRGSYAFASMIETLTSAHALVFEAEATRELYREMLGCDNGVTLYYGVDIAAIDDYMAAMPRDELRRELGAGPEDVVVLNVGTFEPRKAQVALVEAFDRVASRHPGMALWLVGSWADPYSAGVTELLGARTRDAPSVTAFGVSRDVWRYYHAADLLVSASDIESMPRSLMEAIAFGRPIVTTDVAGCQELVHDSISGWTTPRRTTVGLETALERAMLHHEAWRDYADAGRRLLEERHSSAEHGRRFNALLREAAGVSSRSAPA